ncbi:hypothetical protein J27TS8_22030 [Robertmurraya siralis]|uniref:DUF3231 family protein n=1 Tax=Robertmurraya siralis TaxID=77777 RepID=A0A920BTI8_9BACI|nr:DUF3231 family protein [Robertmurraya siralis]PAE20289.1 hypothetical protein CHH80_11860 [Bacillus sp. 7504-2]GIN62210.1 hypothetical protein J27TS8_22030 [Robertmurraya siralis]
MSDKTSISEPLTSVEMGKLWATYMGNNMAQYILTYYLQHVDDKDIKNLLQEALGLSEEFVKTVTEIFIKDHIPIPNGFSEEDVNLNAPRLFQDEFYVHYLKYTSKAGMSIYNVAIPLVYRKDVQEFFRYCMDCTLDLIEKIKHIALDKGFTKKPPLIPTPEKIEFVHEDFLNGFVGHVRPMHALEITHLYDLIESNVTSKALISAFSKVTKDEEIRTLFERGEKVTTRNIENYMKKLHEENLPSLPFLNDLVTSSAFSPFSDKIMLYHKIDMFTIKIRAFGNAVAVNGRRDISMMYTKALLRNAAFLQDATKIMIEKGWFEKPPSLKEKDSPSA